MDRPLDLAGKIEDSDRPTSAERCFAVLNNAVITASGRPVFVVHPGLPDTERNGVSDIARSDE